MHYTDTHYSRNGLPTIEAKGGQTITGQRDFMTPVRFVTNYILSTIDFIYIKGLLKAIKKCIFGLLCF